jgi:ubiquinone/menaquinone biosynthesis C-methylase UbiE
MNTSEIELLAEVEDNHWWYRDRRRKLKTWAKDNFQTGAKILDVGSAAGKQVELLSNLGFKAEGLEYSEIGFKVQQDKGLKVTRGSATSLPWQDETFDGITCMDVLEHIEQDHLAVKEIMRVLKQNGKFLISVPSDPSLWSAHDLSVGHFRRYTKQNLSILLEQSNAKITSVEYWNILLKPIVRVGRKFTNGSDLRKQSRIQNLFFGCILWFEKHFISPKIPGISLWCCGEKNSNH